MSNGDLSGSSISEQVFPMVDCSFALCGQRFKHRRAQGGVGIAILPSDIEFVKLFTHTVIADCDS